MRHPSQLYPNNECALSTSYVNPYKCSPSLSLSRSLARSVSIYICILYTHIYIYAHVCAYIFIKAMHISTNLVYL